MSLSIHIFFGLISPNLLLWPFGSGSEINTFARESVDQNAFIFFQENVNNERVKREDKVWGPWETWSPCSVTCGDGRSIKYRHCISESCGYEEKEAQIRPCHMKPCKTKYFKNMGSQEKYVRSWVPI